MGLYERWAGKFIDQWCSKALRSRIDPVKKFARTVRNHRELLLNYFRARKEFSSGVIEGLNNKAKVTMRKAYGYRSFRIAELTISCTWQVTRAKAHPRFLLTNLRIPDFMAQSGAYPYGPTRQGAVMVVGVYGCARIDTVAKMRPVTAIRRFVFWVLMLAMPLQALAAPGWLCSMAGHHAKLVQHDAQPVSDASGIKTHVDGSTSHSHEAEGVADQAGNESSPQLPGVGKCSACAGCCFTALAVPMIASSPALAVSAHEVVAYVSPAMSARAGDGPFRPPRTLML